MDRNEAIDIVRKNLPYDRHQFSEALETLIPELKESEDDRIRKQILDCFRTMKQQGCFPSKHKEQYNSWIAWLEKQGKETSWKPSKEEMDVLYGLAYITNKNDEHKEEVITRLYQDLKREFFNGSSYENMFPNTENDVRRRSTIQVLEYARSLDNYNQYGKADIDKNIAWLEKQGKKPQGKTALEAINEVKVDNQNCVKNNDKVEPKFKIGDWVIHHSQEGMIYQVEKSFLDDTYRIVPVNDEIGKAITTATKDAIRLWTIQDAKDGDVLSNGEMIVIFKHFEEASYRQRIVAHIGLDTSGDIQITDDTWYLGVDKTKPATKKQRDLLLQKMEESGYEWDTEKKELKKIEKNHPAWSEEDINALNRISAILVDASEVKNWWKVYRLIEKDEMIRLTDFLKSFKDRYIWKPSDEQIIALRWVLNNVPYNKHKEEISGLLDQIKEL